MKATLKKDLEYSDIIVGKPSVLECSKFGGIGYVYNMSDEKIKRYLHVDDVKMGWPPIWQSAKDYLNE